jgi:hypothetical protein
VRENPFTIGEDIMGRGGDEAGREERRGRGDEAGREEKRAIMRSDMV